MSDLPKSADVVVIGSGLSGLTAARDLAKAGVDAVVLEARPRIGGRVMRVVGDSGKRIEGGGELLGTHMKAIGALAEELGAKLVPLAAEGSIVRYFDGERVVEAFPFEDEPERTKAYEEAAGSLDTMAAEVPVEAPWEASRAETWDQTTLASWMDENVEDSQVRAALALEFDFCGANYSELSLLFALWLIHSMGGWATWTEGAATHRIEGGTSVLTEGMAAELEGKVFLDTPVRRVEHGADGVVVHSDRGAVHCRAVIPAISPLLCSRIAWEPALPVDRDRIQTRYLQGHGIKIVAIYDSPWWREEGLAGVAFGLSPTFFMFDATGPEHDDGRLVGFVIVAGEFAGDPDVLGSDQQLERTFLEQASAYLGPRAAEAREIHVTSWAGDSWSAGCAVGLPTGVLTTVGGALRRPVGPIFWAGAETGLPQIDWLEGAVSAGQRAAAEARDHLGVTA